VVDYKKSTGSSGTMMIRDNGSVVSFMINSNNSSTFGTIPWGYTIGGVNNNTRETRYNAGDGWVTLGSWTLTVDQSVTFRIFDTGTSGLGGPTTLTVDIERSSAPNAPSKPVISNVQATSMRLRWTAGANNGAAIDLYQVARNLSNTTTGSTPFNVDLDTTFTGLTPGTTYYWWARTHNAKGWSPYSPVASAKTIKVGDAPDQVIVSDATQTSFVVSFTDNGNGGSTVLERQIAYSTVNTTSGASTVSYTGVRTITGLQPATTYFFWARVRNAAGWGPYSPVVSDRTLAGARIYVGGVVKEAIPWVKVNGVWRLARPWGRIAGTWKQST
jgi:hypothetical protein